MSDRHTRAAMGTVAALPTGALGVRAYAKVNLHLEVLRQRPDGFHNIETVFQSVGLHDSLHVVPRPSGLSMLCDSPDLAVDEENLVMRAARALLAEAGLEEPPVGVRLDLYKRIPIASGFGGGSADAAATLLALNKVWKLQFDLERLTKLAAALGSDVPFCLRGGTAYGSGRGDQLDWMPHLPETVFLLMFPKLPISAEWAYSQLNMGLTRRPRTLSMDRLKTILTQYPKAAQVFHNRLEDAVAPAHPRVAEFTFRLLESGASVAMMTGSGSGIYGVFPNDDAAQAARDEMARSDWPIWLVHSQREGVEFFSND